jgi:hypothetical protein
MKNFGFRTFNASEASFSVSNDLLSEHVPYAVIGRNISDRTLWYVFDVDDDFMHKLRRQSDQPLEIALDLHEWKSREIVKINQAVDFVPAVQNAIAERKSPLFVTDSGAFYGVMDPLNVIGLERRIFASLIRAWGDYVDPDRQNEFIVTLSESPGLGVALALKLNFPNDKESIEVHAQVSSTDFVRLPGESWSQTFRVDQQLNFSPENWHFKAFPVGHRKRYSISVQFSAEGNPLGSLAATMLAEGAGGSPPKFAGAPLEMPSVSGARVLVDVTKQATNISEFHVSVDGVQYEPPIFSSTDFSLYFDKLEQTGTLSKIQDLSYGLWLDLPKRLTEILEAFSGQSTLFNSESPTAPFELLQLNPGSNGPMMGIERPVSRWIPDVGKPETGPLNVKNAACIRPKYTTNPLPSAGYEEEFLASRLTDRMVPVRTQADFDALLNRTDVDLVHFAGHADGDPAHLKLEQNAIVEPANFHCSKPLLKGRKPFFFVNGCRAGAGSAVAPAVLGNFAKALLKSGFSCVVAPHIYVDSKAALLAATTFYEAVLSGSAIDVALQKIREQAVNPSTPEDQRASLLSYLAFTPVGFKLS